MSAKKVFTYLVIYKKQYIMQNRGRSKSRGQSSERAKSTESRKSKNGAVLSHTVTTTRHYLKGGKGGQQHQQQQHQHTAGKPKTLTPQQIAKKEAKQEKIALRQEKRYGREVGWLTEHNPSQVQSYEENHARILAMPVNDNNAKRLRSAEMTINRMKYGLPSTMQPDTEQQRLRDDERLLSETQMLQKASGSSAVYEQARNQLVAEMDEAKQEGLNFQVSKEEQDIYSKAVRNKFISEMYSLRRRFGLPVVWNQPKAAPTAIADARPLAIAMGNGPNAAAAMQRQAPSVRPPGVRGADDISADGTPLNAQMNYDKALWTAGASAGPYVRGGDSLRYL
jgi:hypothetical protein